MYARRLRYRFIRTISRDPVKVIRFTIQNRAAALLFAILILGLGVILLTVGVALIAGLAITGALIGTGIALYRRLRGKPDLLSGQWVSSDARLDPSLEVQPTRLPTLEPPKGPDK
jgi:hypothetical protein